VLKYRCFDLLFNIEESLEEDSEEKISRPPLAQSPLAGDSEREKIPPE
jgi:hypothetical protein